MLTDQNLWQCLLADEYIGLEISDLLEIGSLLWQKGWAEANAGNVSLRFPDTLSGNTQALLKQVIDSSSNYNGINIIDITWFLVSASGSRYRQFKFRGFDNFVLIGIHQFKDNDLDKSEFICYPQTRKPTSEWQTHRLVQQWLSNNRSSDKVVMHTHLTDWITLSNLPDYSIDQGKFIKDLIKYLPELEIYLPNGIALTKYAPPGSATLALETLSAIHQSNAIIWEKHGVVVTAESINQAFDYIEVLSKAAAIYFSVSKSKSGS